MDLLEAVRTRKSIRGYRPDPVPIEVIREILSEAMRSPSALNIQPWKFTVVTGEVLNKIKEGNVEKLTADPQSFHVPSYQGVYRRRQVELAIQLFELMNIKREDSEKRAWWMQKGFRFFDAPVAIIISVDRSLEEEWTTFDAGIVSQTICLLALSHGLGTCIMDQGIAFPEVIRKHTGIPENKKIVIGIALGYPDWDFPANALKSRREKIAQVSSWLGF